MQAARIVEWSFKRYPEASSFLSTYAPPDKNTSRVFSIWFVWFSYFATCSRELYRVYLHRSSPKVG